MPNGFEVTSAFNARSGAVQHGLQRKSSSQKPTKRTALHDRVSKAYMSPEDLAAWHVHRATQAPTAAVRECTPAPRPRTSGQVGPASGSHHIERGTSDQAALRNLSSASGASTAAERGNEMKPPSSPGPCATPKVAECVRQRTDGSVKILPNAEEVRIAVVDGKTHICHATGVGEVFVPLDSSATSDSVKQATGEVRQKEPPDYYSVFTPSEPCTDVQSNSSMEPLAASHVKPEVHLSGLPKYRVGSPSDIIPQGSGAAQAAVEHPVQATSGKLSMQETDRLLGMEKRMLPPGIQRTYIVLCSWKGMLQQMHPPWCIALSPQHRNRFRELMAFWLTLLRTRLHPTQAPPVPPPGIAGPRMPMVRQTQLEEPLSATQTLRPGELLPLSHAWTLVQWTPHQQCCRQRCSATTAGSNQRVPAHRWYLRRRQTLRRHGMVWKLSNAGPPPLLKTPRPRKVTPPPQLGSTCLAGTEPSTGDNLHDTY